MSNAVLAALNASDGQVLTPHLELVNLPKGRFLECRTREVEHVYFIDRGIALVVSGVAHSAEIGIIGREGFTGIAIAMGSACSPYDAFMLTDGVAQRIEASCFSEMMDQSATLRRVMLRSAHAFSQQVFTNLIAMAHNKVEQRLACWILMAHDRADGPDVPITHELLAMMLGVRRPSVSIAAKHLKKIGCIEMRRSAIQILDREALMKRCGGAYLPPAEL